MKNLINLIIIIIFVSTSCVDSDEFYLKDGKKGDTGDTGGIGPKGDTGIDGTNASINITEINDSSCVGEKALLIENYSGGELTTTQFCISAQVWFVVDELSEYVSIYTWFVDENKNGILDQDEEVLHKDVVADGIGVVMTKEVDNLGITKTYWRDLNYNGEYDSDDEFHLSVFSEHPKDGTDGVSSIVTAEFIDDENCTGGARLIITTEIIGQDPVIISRCLEAGEQREIGLILPFTFDDGNYHSSEEAGFYNGNDGDGGPIFTTDNGYWSNYEDFANVMLETPRIVDERKLLNFSTWYTADANYTVAFYGILSNGSNTEESIGTINIEADSNVDRNKDKHWKEWVMPEMTNEAIVGIRLYIHLEDASSGGWIAFDNLVLIYER